MELINFWPQFKCKLCRRLGPHLQKFARNWALRRAIGGATVAARTTPKRSLSCVRCFALHFYSFFFEFLPGIFHERKKPTLVLSNPSLLCIMFSIGNIPKAINSIRDNLSSVISRLSHGNMSSSSGRPGTSANSVVGSRQIYPSMRYSIIIMIANHHLFTTILNTTVDIPAWIGRPGLIVAT